MNESNDPNRGMVTAELADWFRDPRERLRREIGEAQQRNVKRRRRRPKTQPKEA